MKESLKEMLSKYGITSAKELDEALRNLPSLDITVFCEGDFSDGNDRKEVGEDSLRCVG